MSGCTRIPGIERHQNLRKGSQMDVDPRTKGPERLQRLGPTAGVTVCSDVLSFSDETAGLNPPPRL